MDQPPESEEEQPGQVDQLPNRVAINQPPRNPQRDNPESEEELPNRQEMIGKLRDQMSNMRQTLLTVGNEEIILEDTQLNTPAHQNWLNDRMRPRIRHLRFCLIQTERQAMRISNAVGRDGVNEETMRMFAAVREQFRKIRVSVLELSIAVRIWLENGLRQNDFFDLPINLF